MVTQAEKREGNQKPTRFTPPKEGDLVLLRHFPLDQRRGSKLEARWEGAYILSDLSWHRRSGRLLDINTGELVRVKKGTLRNQVHLNDLKIYLPRRTDTMAAANMEMVDILVYEQRTTGEQVVDGYGMDWVGVGGKRFLE